MAKAKHQARGAEALFVSAFTYALTGILVREVSPMWGDKAQVLIRFILVFLFVAGYGLLWKGKLLPPKSKLPLVFSLGLVFAIMVLFFTSAIGKTTVANVLFVFYATNLISAFLLGTVLLKENVSGNKLLAMGCALVGLAVYSGAIADGNLGIIFSIVAGVCGATVSLFSKQLAGVDRGAVLIVQYAVGSLFAAVSLLLSGDELIRQASLKGSVLIVVFALVIVAGSYLTLYGFQNFDVNIGTVIMSAELVFAAVMAYILFNEVPKTHELIGGAFIFAGSVIGSGIFDKVKRPAKQIAQPD